MRGTIRTAALIALGIVPASALARGHQSGKIPRIGVIGGSADIPTTRINFQAVHRGSAGENSKGAQPSQVDGRAHPTSAQGVTHLPAG